MPACLQPPPNDFLTLLALWTKSAKEHTYNTLINVPEAARIIRLSGLLVIHSDLPFDPTITDPIGAPRPLLKHRLQVEKIFDALLPKHLILYKFYGNGPILVPDRVR